MIATVTLIDCIFATFDCIFSTRWGARAIFTTGLYTRWRARAVIQSSRARELEPQYWRDHSGRVTIIAPALKPTAHYHCNSCRRPIFGSRPL